ncbi:MAG: TIGR03618 family F420-dependent PPOX class oxidoreductase [Candidatus Limnocylindrales bacterium]|jgi:PPOX class probable F420-dependent enzyme
MTTPAGTSAKPSTLSAAGRRFLDAPRYAVVATLNPDGSVLQAVIWYALEGDAIVFNSRVGRTWPANLARDPRVSLIVADGEDYIELRGEVEIDEDPVRGQKVIGDLARRHEPDEAARAALLAEFAGQHRVTFELHPTRIYERFVGH